MWLFDIYVTLLFSTIKDVMAKCNITEFSGVSGEVPVYMGMLASGEIPVQVETVLV
jgi:hypothetical protein